MVLIQIARRLRCSDKRRYANIRRRSEAKHCSSLCSQSEGDEYCGCQTRLKIQRRYVLKRWLYSLRVIRQAKKKSATRGRDSFYSRPQFALLAAAGSATCGRRSCYSRPRVDDFVKDFWNPQCCFPIIKVLFGIKFRYPHIILI